MMTLLLSLSQCSHKVVAKNNKNELTFTFGQPKENEANSLRLDIFYSKNSLFNGASLVGAIWVPLERGSQFQDGVVYSGISLVLSWEENSDTTCSESTNRDLDIFMSTMNLTYGSSINTKIVDGFNRLTPFLNKTLNANTKKAWDNYEHGISTEFNSTSFAEYPFPTENQTLSCWVKTFPSEENNVYEDLINLGSMSEFIQVNSTARANSIMTTGFLIMNLFLIMNFF